jgi:hypothetical protein
MIGKARLRERFEMDSDPLRRLSDSAPAYALLILLAGAFVLIGAGYLLFMM